MILPSNGETPSGDGDPDDASAKKRRPKKKSGDGPGGGGKKKDWQPPPEEPPLLFASDPEDEEIHAEQDDDDEGGEEDYEEEPGAGYPTVFTPAGPGWRAQLKRDILACVEELQEIEDPDQDFDPPEPPDLYTFFGELAALRHELRVSGRRSAQGMEKTAGALHHIGELLQALQPALRQTPAGRNEPSEPAAAWPVDVCLALIALYDLVADACPAETARVSFDVLFARAGLERVPSAGSEFNPERMTVTSVEVAPGQPPRTVLRETEAGFLRHGVLLRPARVVISG